MIVCYETKTPHLMLRFDMFVSEYIPVKLLKDFNVIMPLCAQSG